ncbi:hypothetical protein PAPYR_10154 [Paratrimastix pyriformis]|uniref:Uncharacterized protein n=1 Tax=Paratrimastix pyriformis TaxID=342808 RepID=A0ABQ8U6N1_9EUKA|nr:hypothetical protein PAPYR_10154 [Paratrimastix pyriformis]
MTGALENLRTLESIQPDNGEQHPAANRGHPEPQRTASECPPPDYDEWHRRLLAEQWDLACQPHTLVGLTKSQAVANNSEALIEVLTVIALGCRNPNFGPKLRSALIQAGLAAPLTRLLIENGPSATSRVRVVGHILDTIVAVCNQDPENQEAFGYAGIVAPLTALLETFPDTTALPPDLVDPVLVAICNLSDDSDNRAAFGEPVVVDSLARLAASAADPSRATDPAVARALLTAINQLAIDPHNRASFGRTAMISHLTRLLVNNQALATHPLVAEAFFATIGNLVARNPQNQAAFRQAGIIPALADLMVAGRPGLATSSLLLGAIVRLARACPENGAAFLQTRLVDRLRAAPQPGQPILQPFELEQLFRAQ